MFSSLRSATFTVIGFDGNKISKSVFLADTTANAAACSGLWFDPAKDGEGYNVISGQDGDKTSEVIKLAGVDGVECG